MLSVVWCSLRPRVPVFVLHFANQVKLPDQVHELHEVAVFLGQPVYLNPINVVALPCGDDDLALAGIVHVQDDQAHPDGQRRACVAPA